MVKWIVTPRGNSMADIVIDFHKGPPKIGLIVRGKQGPDHHPDKLAQHADTILGDGSPEGFFGEGNDGSLNALGLGMQVYDYALLRLHRAWYVDKASAVTNRVVSTVLLIDVDQPTADKFKDAWDKMTTSPGDFNIVGGNCATHASAAFIAAGVVSKTIPWMDTPDNLYQQLVDNLPAGRVVSYTGYIGFKPNPSGGYDMEITPYVASPAVAAPNPGSSGSLSTAGGSGNSSSS
jgi:hypothetical protein